MRKVKRELTIDLANTGEAGTKMELVFPSIIENENVAACSTSPSLLISLSEIVIGRCDVILASSMMNCILTTLKGQSHELRMRDFLPLGALTQASRSNFPPLQVWSRR